MTNSERHDAAQAEAVANAFRRFEGKDQALLKEWQRIAGARYASNGPDGGPTHQNFADCRVLLYLLNPDTQPDPRKETTMAEKKNPIVTPGISGGMPKATAPAPKAAMSPKLIVVHHKLAVPVNIWLTENDYSFEFEHGGEVIKGDHFESVAKALEGAVVAVKKAMG